MADTPNYNESEVSGTSWQRAVRVVIENPFKSQPSITFVEEKIYNIGLNPIKENGQFLTTTFDANNPLHVEIYTKLNDLYIVLREARDLQLAESLQV